MRGGRARPCPPRMVLYGEVPCTTTSRWPRPGPFQTTVHNYCTVDTVCGWARCCARVHFGSSVGRDRGAGGARRGGWRGSETLSPRAASHGCEGVPEFEAATKACQKGWGSEGVNTCCSGLIFFLQPRINIVQTLDTTVVQAPAAGDVRNFLNSQRFFFVFHQQAEFRLAEKQISSTQQSSMIFQYNRQESVA